MSRFEQRAGRTSLVSAWELKSAIAPKAAGRFSPGFIHGSVAGVLDVSYIGVNHDGASTTNAYFFPAQNIGTAAADRYVFLNIQWFSTANAPVLTACTIGGVAAVIVLQSATINSRPSNAIAYALVPNDTTATIAFTFSGNLSGTGHGVGFGIYRVQGPLDPTPVATRQNDDVAVSSLNTVIAVKKNGFMIWSVTAGNVNFVMNAPTQNYGRQYGAGRTGYGAFASGYGADTNQALTLSNTTSTSRLQDVAASFAPL